MKSHYVHRFENEYHLAWELLQQEAYFLKVNLVLAPQELHFLFGNWRAQGLCGVDCAVGEEQRQVAEVFADAEGTRNISYDCVIHSDK